jgi:CDP-6-deoxy-D-xylo-4-hexulose-3-dehydrase
MSIESQITDFLNNVIKNNTGVFPYIYNNESFDSTKSTVYYSGPYWNQQEVEAMFLSLISGKWLSSGESVFQFEREFSQKFNFTESVMVNSGSSANLVMVAALKKYFNWNDGDEIIVSCVGFPTTISVILQNNLTPVFVDIDPTDLNWDITQLEQKITSRTRALFSSPVLGNPYNFDAVIDLCERYNIRLISDNCDSLGSKYKGNYLTDYSVAASCSFYPAHHITTIEGGMVSSKNPEIVKLARSFAWWGRDCTCVGAQNLLCNGMCKKRFSQWLDDYAGIVDHKYVFTNIGYNLKPMDCLGAVGSVQLTKFDEIHAKRRSNKEQIGQLFEKIPGVRVVQEQADSETSWFGVPIVCESKEQKTKLVAHLESNRIQTRNYFAGNILLHPGYKHLDNAQLYPNANRVLDTVFFVGCSPTISQTMIDYIGSVIL